jgi:hypothetical protein
VQQLRERLGRAQGLSLAAQRGEARRRLLLAAQAELELGSYGVACRKLRLAYRERPDDEALAQLYAQALVAARLEAEASQVVARALGPERAAHVVAALVSQLPVAQRSMPAVAAESEWWRAE